MQTRKQAVLLGAAIALAASPAFAKVGVDENAASPATGSAPSPSGDGGSSLDTGWEEKEGGFHIGRGDYKLVIGGRLQPGFDYIAWDDSVQDEDTVTFRLRRARVYLLGNFMGPDNTYYVQFGADSDDPYWGDSGTEGDFQLFDAWLKHSWGRSFYLKGGQFKAPFSRQNLTSSGKLQFPNRSLATEAMAFDLRDVGAEIGGGMSDDKFQWAFAVVNGDGPNQLNADDRVGVYGRFAFNPTGNYGYSEGDGENSDTLASTVAIAGHYQKRPSGTEYTRVNLDGGLKYRGWSVQAELDWNHRKFEEDDDSTDDESAYLQGGFFIDPKTVEIVARWSRIINDGDDNDDSEYSAGLNWYFMGHRLKWQTAYSYFDSQAGEVKNHRLTTQAQIWF